MRAADLYNHADHCEQRAADADPVIANLLRSEAKVSRERAQLTEQTETLYARALRESQPLRGLLLTEVRLRRTGV